MLRNMPVTLRYGVPIILLVTAAILVGRGLMPRVLAVHAVGFEGMAFDSTGLTAELYPYDGSGAGDYPPQPIGEIAFGTSGRFDLPIDRLSGGQGQVVARTQAHGIAWAHLDPARGSARLEFGLPLRMVGRVTRAGDVGIAHAHVQVLSDRYGVLLAEATCDAHGGFEVDGLSSSNTFYTLRARAEGFALRVDDVQVVDGHPIALKLSSTRPVTGQVTLPSELVGSELHIRAFRVPGLSTRALADGGFYLDHLPAPPTRVRLLVGGLPAGFTHRATLVTAGDKDVAVRIVRSARVRGYVVRADNDAPVVGAYVEHPHGPRGDVGAYTDAQGAFELDFVPSGTVRIEAFAARPRPRSPHSAAAEQPNQVTGWAEIEVAEGVDANDVVVRVF